MNNPRSQERFDENRILDILRDLLLANEISVIQGEPMNVNPFMFFTFHVL